MSQNLVDGKQRTRLARPPPNAAATRLQWQPEENTNGARLRLDRRVPPPTFAIASPGPGEGEAMAKAGGEQGVFI